MCVFEEGEGAPPIVPCPGPLVARAAAYTAGVVGGLVPLVRSTSSGTLSLGLGVVLVSSLGE